jgi:hypothetical protein
MTLQRIRAGALATILTIVVAGCGSAQDASRKTVETDASFTPGAAIRERSTGPRSNRGALAERAARLARSYVVRLVRGKYRSTSLVVAAETPRCSESAPTTYTCYVIVQINSRPGQNFEAGLESWTVTVAVDHASNRMSVVRASEGLEPPERGR